MRNKTGVHSDGSAPVIDVDRLRVVLPRGDRECVEAIRDVSLTINAGERVGIVGESGSGKSITGRAIAGLLPESPRVTVGGSIRLFGRELVGGPAATWQLVRRRHVSMVFQDPLSYLNPTMRIGRQIAEAYSPAAGDRGRDAVMEKVAYYLEKAGLERSSRVWEKYPFQLSGGMRQRALIAMALAKDPDLIIADEPTTALDVTVQAQVLSTLKATVTEAGKSLLMVSHDLAVIADMCDRVYVMYAGQVVEEGATEAVFGDPQHEYTRSLIASVRRLGQTRSPRPIDSVPTLNNRSKHASIR